MLAPAHKRESLPIFIEVDPSTGLPLLSQQRSIFELVIAYLQLPYSVAEYGCGKKAHLILSQLSKMGVPVWALKRGLILEHDLRPVMLDEFESRRRPGALVVENPLYRLGNLNDANLRRMLEAASDDITTEGSVIHAGPFALHHAPWVQFVLARSHVYSVITFWDDQNHRAVDRVIDPTLEQSEPFEVERIRELTHAPEALVFEAPLLGRFRLTQDQVTEAQAQRIGEFTGKTEVSDLDDDDHAALVRHLTGAALGSIGDPKTWTYANNMRNDADPQQTREDERTGLGDAIRPLCRRLRESRESHDPLVTEIRADLERTADRIQVSRVVKRDAVWAAEQLEPLAVVAITMVAYRSIGLLAQALSHGRPVADYLTTVQGHRPLRGLGVRLRRRIDRLALASEDSEGRIHARALSPEYARCVTEAIHQMNAAGLTVFVDRVGNVHGLMLGPSAREALAEGRVPIAELTRHAVFFCSHLDTVSNAGKFDGRLGVASGVEVCHLLADLHRYFDVRVGEPASPVTLGVSAFVGEEMSFTGQGVSMPGSAAVAGHSAIEEIDEMVDDRGRRYRDALVEMLRHLRERQLAGDIKLTNAFSSDDSEALLAQCSDPKDFFSRHTYERHVEQGPVLDMNEVPTALVTTVMGIHQEDIVLLGRRAEEAGLWLASKLRDLPYDAGFEQTRITVGVMRPEGEPHCDKDPAFSLRCVLTGEMNHAGATPMLSRKDPVVAMGRLSEALAEWCSQHSTDDRRLEPLVGDVALSPGTARNVIPHSASATLGVRGAPMTATERRRLESHLAGFASGGLSREAFDGGEGVSIHRMEPAGFVNVSPKLSLSVDLRAADEETIDASRKRIAKLLTELERRFSIEASTSVRQELPPQPLARTGQVLLVERSYGGSHNPHETELTADLTRGTILQLAVAVDVLSRASLDGIDLVDIADKYLPNRWKRRVKDFVSGAPHDSCNISARILAM